VKVSLFGSPQPPPPPSMTTIQVEAENSIYHTVYAISVTWGMLKRADRQRSESCRGLLVAAHRLQFGSGMVNASICTTRLLRLRMRMAPPLPDAKVDVSVHNEFVTSFVSLEHYVLCDHVAGGNGSIIAFPSEGSRNLSTKVHLLKRVWPYQL
jgi:hypothetical protein